MIIGQAGGKKYGFFNNIRLTGKNDNDIWLSFWEKRKDIWVVSWRKSNLEIYNLWKRKERLDVSPDKLEEVEEDGWISADDSLPDIYVISVYVVWKTTYIGPCSIWAESVC